jgi:DNA-binding transcriptional MerR regulator
MASLSISDFSRATQLGIKALRHYHRIGLLVPDDVDALTGYRRYGPDQIGDALVIRQFRDLEMPLEQIRELLGTSDAERRAAVLREHLDQLIGELGRMRDATERLDELLEPRSRWPEVELVTMPAFSGIAIRDQVEAASAMAWLQGALAELGAALRQAGMRPVAPAFGLYEDGIFTDGSGEGTVLVPCEGPVRLVGRLSQASVPAAELCVATHRGPHPGIERAYGALGEHVARHEIAVPGPLREVYFVGPLETPEEADWVTQVAWPVFRTRGEAAGDHAA